MIGRKTKIQRNRTAQTNEGLKDDALEDRQPQQTETCKEDKY